MNALFKKKNGVSIPLDECTSQVDAQVKCVHMCVLYIIYMQETNVPINILVKYYNKLFVYH